MIHVRVEWPEGGNRILVCTSGHAGYAEHGQDIVCAAVSTLMGTLEYNLRLSAGADGFRLEAAEGYMLVEMRDPGETEIEAFHVVVNGLCMVAERYGEYVQIEIE